MKKSYQQQNNDNRFILPQYLAAEPQKHQQTFRKTSYSTCLFIWQATLWRNNTKKKQTAHNCKRNKVIKLIVSLFQLQRAVRGSSSTVAWGTLTHTKRRYITLCVHSYLAADHREINSKSLRETRTEEINKLFIEKAN